MVEGEEVGKKGFCVIRVPSAWDQCFQPVWDPQFDLDRGLGQEYQLGILEQLG